MVQQAPAPRPTLDFSGVLFANFQYGGAKGNRAQNRFDLDRAYLNFRLTPADRYAIRVTADVFQQRDTTRDAFYRGWAFRAKYAYLQYDFYRRDNGRSGVQAYARVGLLNTVIIDTEEQIWPRGIAQTSTDRLGFFSSSDAGISSTLTLPNELGEVYGSVTNGAGYQSREIDRFKDYAARLTLTPFARSGGYLKGLGISPWYSLGSRASDFARRRGTVAAVQEGRTKNRTGLLVVVRDPRVTFGVHAAWRFEQDELADTTRDIEPLVRERTARVVSGYLITRPLAIARGEASSPLALLLRLDDYRPDVDVRAGSQFRVAGLMYELNRRLSLTLDHQSEVTRGGSSGPDVKTWFLHIIANF